MTLSRPRSVAIVGAGAAGAATAAAFAAEKCYDRIQVFERRESAGGTWIHDPDPGPLFELHPGKLPPEIDPPLRIPSVLPTTTSHSEQQRYEKTPIYSELTTNVPAIAMSFSDKPFPYGPFVPHHVPKQYIENYFSTQRTDSLLVLDTTVEDLSKTNADGWILTLRRYDPVRKVDVWWKEQFDAVVLANGHYSVPFVPVVKGLEEYIRIFPDRIVHSKLYRSSLNFVGKTVLVIGNSASGHDVSMGLIKAAKYPVYQSRRSRGLWDGDSPPAGIEWKPVVKEFLVSGDILFDDDSVLSNVDVVIYCTGYKASFPFWNTRANGSDIWDYSENRLVGSYQHTFFREFPTLGIVGVPRTLTFRSFEYQAIALARVFAGRNAHSLPSKEDQKRWDEERWNLVVRERRKYHDIPWDSGETMAYFKALYDIAGLPQLEDEGRCPPVLDEKTRWEIENIKKYPIPPKEKEMAGGWLVVDSKDSLQFI